MAFIRLASGLFLIAFVAFLFYVRFAPSDPTVWHVPVEASGDADMAGGALRVIPADGDTLARADQYMLSLPRTEVLAGAVDRDRITYVTRSRVFGFPDYTTLEYVDGQLRAFARLRFGQSDLGVNRMRLEGLLAALQGG